MSTEVMTRAEQSPSQPHLTKYPLGGVIFWVTASAEKALNRYLQRLRLKVNHLEDPQPVWERAELQLAEMLLLELSEDHQGVNHEHIEQLKREAEDRLPLREWAKAYERQAEQATRLSKLKATVGQTKQPHPQPGRLALDPGNAIVSGLAAGIGRYLGLSPIWLRLMLVLSFYDLVGVPVVTVSVLIGYLAGWLWLRSEGQVSDAPASYRPVYREMDQKWIGGVAGGLAAYANAPVWLVRIILVDSALLGGIGIVAYLTFWSFLPGKPPEISWSQLYGRRRQPHKADRSIWRRIDQATQLASAALRLVLMLLLSVFSLSMIVSLLAIMLIFYLPDFQELPGVQVRIDDIPTKWLPELFPIHTGLMAFASLVIPFVMLLMFSLTSLFRRWQISGSVYIASAMIWLISLLGLGIFIPSLLNRYSETSYDLVSHAHTVAPNDTLLIELNALENQPFQRIGLKVLGHAGSRLEVHRKTMAKGETRTDAKHHAQRVSYRYDWAGDNRLILDSHFRLPSEAPFRFQGVTVGVNLPFCQPFRLSPSLRHHLDDPRFAQQPNESVWSFESNGELGCLANCR